MKKNTSLVVFSLLAITIIGVISHITKLSTSQDNIVNDKDSIIAGTQMTNITKTETQKEIIYEVIDNNKKLEYSWTFKKNDKLNNSLKENIGIDISLKLDIINNIKNQDFNNSLKDHDKLIISFEHHGELPTKAKVKLDVSDSYNDGEMLYLYYLNEEEGNIEYIDNNIKVKNGYAEFEISHCSDYFLTASIVQDAVNNPKNINLIIIVMVVVIIVLIGATLFQNKK